MDTEVTEQQEQLMADASHALAALADAMIARLPETNQAQLSTLMARGASLGMSCILTPRPMFRLCLVPLDPRQEAVELAICSPSAGSLRLPGSGEVAH